MYRTHLRSRSPPASSPPARRVASLDGRRRRRRRARASDDDAPRSIGREPSRDRRRAARGFASARDEVTTSAAMVGKRADADDADDARAGLAESNADANLFDIRRRSTLFALSPPPRTSPRPRACPPPSSPPAASPATARRPPRRTSRELRWHPPRLCQGRSIQAIVGVEFKGVRWS